MLLVFSFYSNFLFSKKGDKDLGRINTSVKSMEKVGGKTMNLLKVFLKKSNVYILSLLSIKRMIVEEMGGEDYLIYKINYR